MSTHSAELQGTEPESLDRERIFDLFRRWGYLDADLYPLGRPAGEFPELQVEGPLAEEARRIYCGTVSAEFMHLPQRDRREWLQEQMENGLPQKVNRPWLAERLLQADLFEQILQTRYLGTKRYSGEGATSLIPLLDTVLETGADRG
ncbi:MAG: 2-oxoglutarate dehydrogenase E1 component, partial [Candidatus Angelobacter sp.]